LGISNEGKMKAKKLLIEFIHFLAYGFCFQSEEFIVFLAFHNFRESFDPIQFLERNPEINPTKMKQTS